MNPFSLSLVLKPSIALAAVLVLAACSTATERSDKVSQQSIHQMYSASYDQGQDVSRAFAQFRFGDGTGTTLSLSSPSQIDHNLYKLEERNILGTSYFSEGPGFQPLHVFDYTNNSGQHFRNSAAITAVGFNLLPASVSRSGDATFGFVGDALGAGESVTVTIEGASLDGENESVFATTSNVGATAVVVPGASLKKLSNRNYSVSLKRVKRQPLREATEKGGTFTTEFTTAKQPLAVVD